MGKLITQDIENKVYEIFENFKQDKRFDEYYSEHLGDFTYLEDPEDIEVAAIEAAETDIAEEAIEEVLKEIKNELIAAWFYGGV